MVLMEKIAIAVTNHKGGVGKTTIAHILSQIIAQNNKMKVIAYDLDPQRNLTDSLSLVDFPNLEIKHGIGEKDETLDANAFIIDCPPALNSIVEDAISFADIVLVPVFADLYSVTNLDVLFRRIKEMGKIDSQIALVKNCLDETILSRDLDDFLTEKHYPVAGRLPRNRLIRSNISNGNVWNYRVRSVNQTPFISLLERTRKAFNALLAGKTEQAWK